MLDIRFVLFSDRHTLPAYRLVTTSDTHRYVLPDSACVSILFSLQSPQGVYSTLCMTRGLHRGWFQVRGSFSVGRRKRLFKASSGNFIEPEPIPFLLNCYFRWWCGQKGKTIRAGADHFKEIISSIVRLCSQMFSETFGRCRRGILGFRSI